jgi:hypothetical protein
LIHADKDRKKHFPCLPIAFTIYRLPLPLAVCPLFLPMPEALMP